VNAEQEERAFLASAQSDEAFRQLPGGQFRAVTFAQRPTSPDDARATEVAILTKQFVPRPTSRSAVLEALTETSDEVEFEAAQLDVAL
jgi:hypothetical protein